jgi:hypothetical protein
MCHGGYPKLIAKLFVNDQVWKSLQPKGAHPCLAEKGMTCGGCRNGPHGFLDSLFKSSRGPKRALGIIGDGFIKLLKSFGMKHDLLHHSEVFLPKTGKDFFGRNADDFAITNFPHSTL